MGLRNWAWGLLALWLGGCGGSAEDAAYRPVLSPGGGAQTVYVVGVHPLHNPQRLLELYGPLVDELNAGMPEVELRLEASRNYQDYERKLYGGHFHFAMPNPYQTVRALDRGYRVFGKMAPDEDFRGLILVRRDAGIARVSDLKGRAVAYPAPTALAATLLPQHYLHTRGLDVNRDIDNRYVGSQESTIEVLRRGQVAAAATWPVPWESYRARHPEVDQELLVKWQTAPLVNNGWVVRGDVPAADAQRFAALLLGLHQNEHGRALLQALQVARFEPASAASYQPVRVFLAEFSRLVRPLEE